MKAKILLPLVVLLTIAVANVNGQTIRQKNRHEKARIAQGVKSGELTKRETVRLARNQREISKDIRQAKKDDGHIDRQERKEIRKEERKQNRRIFVAKHNRRERK